MVFGNTLYCYTGTNGELYSYTNEFSLSCRQFESETSIKSLASFDGNLYGGSESSGYLLKASTDPSLIRGFTNGFNDAFGLFISKFEHRIKKRNKFYIKENKMESMILTGASSSGMYLGRPGLYLNIESIQFSIPLSGLVTDASVTLSGVNGTKNYTFNDSVSPVIKFGFNEDVYITTNNFLPDYSVIINYTQGGDMSSYMQTDHTRDQIGAVPTFWRFR